MAVLRRTAQWPPIREPMPFGCNGNGLEMHQLKNANRGSTFIFDMAGMAIPPANLRKWYLIHGTTVNVMSLTAVPQCVLYIIHILLHAASPCVSSSVFRDRL